MTDNATLCPVCGKKLISLCKTSIPPIYESYCPNCQYSRRESSHEVGSVKLVTAMPDRERIIAELSERANGAGADAWMTLKCSTAREILALLKEREARVMTWEEMIAAGKEEKAVYVEECPKGDPVRCFWGIAFPGIEPPKDKPFNYPGGVDFNVTDVESDIWDGDFYNMNAPLGWRAWTSRPTDEQRRNTPWEPQKEEDDG